MSISLPITITPQELAVIVVAFIVLLILLLLTSRRRRRGAVRVRRQRPARSGRKTKRRDHGAEIANRHGTARSPQWHRVAHEHLLHEPACVACGYHGQGLQVHHVKPFHLHPSLELDPRNLVTLCEIPGRDHHLLIGHLDEWESYNVNVREDARRFHSKTADQIRRDPYWQKKVAQRPH